MFRKLRDLFYLSPTLIAKQRVSFEVKQQQQVLQKCTENLFLLQDVGNPRCRACDQSCEGCRGPSVWECTLCPASQILSEDGRCLSCCGKESRYNNKPIPRECCDCEASRGEWGHSSTHFYPQCLFFLIHEYMICSQIPHQVWFNIHFRPWKDICIWYIFSV